MKVGRRPFDQSASAVAIARNAVDVGAGLGASGARLINVAGSPKWWAKVSETRYRRRRWTLHPHDLDHLREGRSSPAMPSL